MNERVAFGVIISAVVTAFAILFLGWVPDQRIPSAVSFTWGVPLALFTTYIIYLLQAPDFEATIKPSETKGKLPGEAPEVATTRWVHLSVRNTSVGFLGGGTAANVGAILRIEDFSRTREFRPKWETQRNPLSVTPLYLPNQVVYQVIPDETQMEAAKRETLEPGEVKSLDVAFKTRGDRNCYISIPENFRFPGLRNEDAAYPPGGYVFHLLIEYKGKPRLVGTFLLVNEEGTEPENLTVEEVS